MCGVFRPIVSLPRRAAIWCLAVLAVPQLAAAQYFGQNKVLYERFDFQILRTPTLDIYHYPENADAVRRIAPLAEEWRRYIGEFLDVPVQGRQPVVLYSSHAHFVQTTVVEGRIGEGTGGVTEGLRRRVVLPFAWTLDETSHVLGHELVHAFQYEVGGVRLGRLPLWFVEGMAEYVSLGADHVPTAMWLRDAVAREDVPAITDLDNPKYFPYRYGHALWAFLAQRFGPQIVGQALIEGVRAGDPFTALEVVTGQPIAELSAQWQTAVRQRHASHADIAAGRVLVASDQERGGMLNVGPTLSPDGRWLAYLSERDGFAIDLFVADAQTGRVVRRITSAAVDPHLENVQFVGSTGGWDPTSRSLAFTTLRGGKPTLSVVDVVGDRREPRHYAIEEVSDAWHPAWAPDGARIAFAGHAGGTTDLFELTLSTGRVRQLTNDAFADLQPAWSPDGRRLAFLTDRFTSSLDRLSFGPVQLAMLTVDTGAIEPVAKTVDGGHNTPQWNRDGTALYFIGAPDGVAQVFRLDVRSGELRQLTDVATGVSGIADSSPALSYAPGADRLAFTVFRGGGYAINVLEPDDLAKAPTRGRQAVSDRRASTLFGADGEERARPGTPGTTTAALTETSIEPYHARLELDAIGAEAGVGGVGNRGVFFGGGLGMRFSDMIGRHVVNAFVMANGGVRDIGGQVGYLNRESRWQWGAAALYQPYATGGFGQAVQQTPGGTPVLVDEELIIRQDEAQLMGIAAYPFSRAMRVEFAGGGRRIWFARELTTRLFDLRTGRQIDEVKNDLGAPDGLTLGEASAALVYDQTLFGPTGPLIGQRYRLEVAPTIGSLQFTGVTADFRRYFEIARPYSLAFRLLHVGRYGNGGEDPRLAALFLGYPTLVRGYDVGSFSADECGPVTADGCAAFDRLLGSRLLIGNAELRVPLFGAFSGQYRYGPLPIEAFAFADGGVAWTAADGPKIFGDDRRSVTSAGAGLRINLFGAAIGQFVASRPFDRPQKGWTFAFYLLPGF
jgi:Tol biopolymer transport system component